MLAIFRIIFKQNLFLIKALFITPASENDFELIKKLIQQFELDDRDLHYHQFLVAKENDELLGFGRIRLRENCSELCSLGVVESQRLQGIGKRLVKELIFKSQAQAPLYLVCIIPEFFIPFGFKVVSEYPAEMQEKLNYCSSELIVPETYVVMKYV